MHLHFFGATCRENFKVKDKHTNDEFPFHSELIHIIKDRQDCQVPTVPGIGGEIDWRSVRIEVLGVWDTVGALGAETRFTRPYT